MEGDDVAEAAELEEPGRIGIRDVFSSVNLRDFFDMVKGEFALVAASARNAVQSHPLLLPLALLLVVLRFLLLVGVVIVLGGGIAVVMLVRGGARAIGLRGKPAK